MRALYPGSFDPPHLGHLDVILRAAAACEHLVVGVARNYDKQAAHPIEQRVAWLAALTADLPAVEVVAFSGATVTFAKERGLRVLIRGLRNHADFEAEQAMATVNRSHGCDTVFLMTDPLHAHVSSRLVRMVAAAGLPLADLVPAVVAADLVRAASGITPCQPSGAAQPLH